jgi:hypothetical protein
MNLAELLATNPDLPSLRGLALVLSPALHDTLTAVQATLPERACVVQALPLTDGRWMLGADLLSEIGPGGLYHEGFGQLPPTAFPAVEVIPMAEAVAQLPTPDPEP